MTGVLGVFLIFLLGRSEPDSVAAATLLLHTLTVLGCKVSRSEGEGEREDKLKGYVHTYANIEEQEKKTPMIV